jgi:hypothetical protein
MVRSNGPETQYQVIAFIRLSAGIHTLNSHDFHKGRTQIARFTMSDRGIRNTTLLSLVVCQVVNQTGEVTFFNRLHGDMLGYHRDPKI